MAEDLKIILPAHPDGEDILDCQDQLVDIQILFEGGDGQQYTYKNLHPYVQNLVSVSSKLMKRAALAESRYLDTETKVEFDYVLLGGTIKKIRNLHKKVLAYARVTEKTKNLPEIEQVQALVLSVYTPLFYGSGYKDPEDDQSPWVQGQTVWCQPMSAAVELEEVIGWHVESWKYQQRIREKGANLGFVLLGGATLYGGFKLFQHMRRR